MLHHIKDTSLHKHLFMFYSFHILQWKSKDTGRCRPSLTLEVYEMYCISAFSFNTYDLILADFVFVFVFLFLILFMLDVFICAKQLIQIKGQLWSMNVMFSTFLFNAAIVDRNYHPHLSLKKTCSFRVTWLLKKKKKKEKKSKQPHVVTFSILYVSIVRYNHVWKVEL